MFTVTVPRKGIPKHSNVSVGASTAVQISSANAERKVLVIQNTGSNSILIGDSTVAATGASAGFVLAAGLSFYDEWSNTEWWAISSTGTNIVHAIDVT